VLRNIKYHVNYEIQSKLINYDCAEIQNSDPSVSNPTQKKYII